MDKLKNAMRAIFLAVQKALVTGALFAAYLFGIGAMAALSRVFGFLPGRPAGKDSFWEKAAPLACDIKDAGEQS